MIMLICLVHLLLAFLICVFLYVHISLYVAEIVAFWLLWMAIRECQSNKIAGLKDKHDHTNHKIAFACFHVLVMDIRVDHLCMRYHFDI